MADTSTYSTPTIDPFFILAGQVTSVREKVSDSVYESYKLQVAQSNDINNRAMQVALHDATALADLKTQGANGTLQTMLAAASVGAAVARSGADITRLAYEQGELDRRLLLDLNTQNLNTALINTNSALTGLNGLYGGLSLAYGGAVGAVQSANSVSALNAVRSAAATNGNINTGIQSATTQTSTPTVIG